MVREFRASPIYFVLPGTVHRMSREYEVAVTVWRATNTLGAKRLHNGLLEVVAVLETPPSRLNRTPIAHPDGAIFTHYGVYTGPL